MADSIFKYSETRKFLAKMREIAPVVPLGGWDGKRAIILRHDIDLDIEPAYRLHEIEMEIGVCSTYFIMVTNHSYNPFSQRNRKWIQSISDNGFEIGLHVDPMIYPNSSKETLQKAVDTEAAMLAQLVGKKIASVSLHNPSDYGKYPLFEGYRNAYDPRIFRDECYLSDARMQFRGKDPMTFIERAREDTLQVLMHPLHFTADGADYPDIFSDFGERFLGHLDKWWRVNYIYVEQMPGTLLDYMGDRLSSKPPVSRTV